MVPDTRFRFGARMHQFAQRLQTLPAGDHRFLYYGAVWLTAFFLLFSSLELPSGLWFLSTIAGVVFLLLFLDEVFRKLSPPAEVLVISMIVTMVLDSQLLSGLSTVPVGLLKPLHLLLLAAMVLALGLLLVANNQGKKGVVVRYMLLAYVGIQVLDNQNVLLHLLIQIVLFALLLRRTGWLEELTKAECWLYWLVVILCTRAIWTFDPFGGNFDAGYAGQHIWYAGPYFSLILIKMYLLALVVKIPVVLVYNFASLSRKLKISSLFQSTFPQVFQLVLLLIMFYLFVAGWQGEKLRGALLRTIEQVAAGETRGLSWLTLDVSAGPTLAFDGYDPVPLPTNLPARGILELAKKANNKHETAKDGYVIFAEQDSDDETSRTVFVKLDSAFLEVLARNTSLLAGSYMSAYAYSPLKWEVYFYDYFGTAFRTNEHDFSIFPFGHGASRADDALAVSLTSDARAATGSLSRNWTERNRHSIVVGRVVAHVFNAGMPGTAFFAMDILLQPGLSIFTPTLFGYVGVLLLIYAIANLAVTRRMVGFGDEINRTIVEKFNQLKHGIREISSGNFDYKVAVEGEDEFVELGERFNEMGVKLKQSIAEARDKERLEHELTLAREVQLRLLPTKLPEVPGFEIAATLRTANEVGGDFYDVLPLDAGRFLVAVGDVSGKGTSAAFYMAQCMSLLRYSPQFTRDPREIALRLDEYFSSTTVDKQIFVTAILGVLDAKSGSLSLVRAGHTPPILVPANAGEAARELQIAGAGIGIQERSDRFSKFLVEKKVALQEGDALVLLTDGVEEAARMVAGTIESELNGVEFFGLERVTRYLKDRRDLSAQDLVEGLRQEVETFYAGSEQHDDFTIMVVRRRV